MNLLYYLKRPFIWLSRFRYRCGYGVHSPFAFSLITDVIYEKMPYYAYDLLKVEQKKGITTPVSYTHRDVYKRQVFDCRW